MALVQAEFLLSGARRDSLIQLKWKNGRSSLVIGIRVKAIPRPIGTQGKVSPDSSQVGTLPDF
jgi:hypothetical protein